MLTQIAQDRLRSVQEAVPDPGVTKVMQMNHTPASQLLSDAHQAALEDLVKQQGSRREMQKQLEADIQVLQEAVGRQRLPLLVPSPIYTYRLTSGRHLTYE